MLAPFPFPTATYGIVVGRLSNNPVAHSAVNKATNQISRVKFVREAKFNPAGFIEPFQLVGRKRKIITPKIVLKLRELSRPDNWDDRHWPITQPSQRHLRHAATYLIGDRFDGCDNAPGSLFLRHELL